MSDRNTYLENVVAQQAQTEQSMKSRSRKEEPDAPPSGVDVRVTGWWRWKTVLVPPNAFVVHTRRGHDAPLHMGLGISFGYNPVKDSYLVVPGTMQTIMLNAYCICQELQGVVVQAYVQWIVQDIAAAYQRLDFADQADPMRVVNLQLKEQAEAAIKDKVATMGVREVLSDKQPIIEELTARLRDVAEASMGLRIVTVQIKEAVVSSTRLWENLQKPYRAEQSQIARLAEIGSEEIVNARQLANERKTAELKAGNKRASASADHETMVHALQLEQERNAQEVEIGRLRIELEQTLQQLKLEHELSVATARAENANAIKLLEIERARLRQAINNEQTPIAIQARLVAELPDIMAKLPKPTELRTVSFNGTNQSSLSGVIAELTAVLKALQS